VRPITGVRDYSCGFRLYRAATIAEGFARDGDDFVTERGFACMVEIAERLRGYADFAEVPFVLRYDAKRKESAIKIGPTIRAYFRALSRIVAARRKPVPWITLVAAFTSVMLGVFAQRALQSGVAGLGLDASAIATLQTSIAQPGVWLGVGLFGVSALLWLGVLSRMDLAVAYPFGGVGYAAGLVLSVAAGYSATPLQWFGAGLIVLGALIASYLGVSPRKGAL